MSKRKVALILLLASLVLLLARLFETDSSYEDVLPPLEYVQSEAVYYNVDSLLMVDTPLKSLPQWK